MKRIGFLVALGMAGALALGSQPTDIQVRLYWLQSPAQLRVAGESGNARVSLCSPCGDAQPILALEIRASGNRVEVPARAWSGDSIELAGIYRLEPQGHPALKLSYPLRINAADGRLKLAIRIPLEEYVAGVLAGESSSFTSKESLKAMAVAARTFAVRFRGRHQAEGFDFCDTTHCQDLRLSAVRPRLEEAASATEGELVWYEGEPAATFYHRHCGGTTEAGRFLEPGIRAPYLRQQLDAYCVARDASRWQTEITREELQVALRESGLLAPAPPDSLVVTERTPSGRALRVELSAPGPIALPASALRLAVGRALGWDRIRSDFYEVRAVGDRFVFHGRGHGHGVGLCQVGAARMGEQGKSYREILSFYFPGTVQGLTAGGLNWRAMASERVELLTTSPEDDRELLAAADRLLAAAERQTRWRLVVRPQLRVYPTVETYRNATGEPGWVAASSRGRIVRLQPARVLRAAGTLEATLEHELLHLLMEARAHPGLPLWFREGLVLYLVQGRSPVIPSGSSMPTAELERVLSHPRSQEELRRGYAAARARVAALVERHGLPAVLDWIERGLPRELAHSSVVSQTGNQGTQQ